MHLLLSVRLDTVMHFSIICFLPCYLQMSENTRTMYAIPDDHYTFEEGRLVYLSIPPAAYAKTASYVNKHLRPRVGRPWFRVVLEKPFGQDSESARGLAEKLSKSFKEEEIYRIDHYLGKAIVKLILPFRYVSITLKCDSELLLLEPTCAYARWALMHRFLYVCV